MEELKACAVGISMGMVLVFIVHLFSDKLSDRLVRISDRRNKIQS